jgi:hypothetical protein
MKRSPPSRNRLHLAGSNLITTANCFRRPGSADLVIRKRIEAFDEAIRQQCARLGRQSFGRQSR